MVCTAVRFSRVILTGGTIRTMEPSLPTSAALAIAGDRIAGGVGTHETALPGPERVDLGGRCVVPGFSDAHVHYPTWALAQRQLRLEGCVSLAEAVVRVEKAAAEVAGGGPTRWLIGHGWRSGDWSRGPEPTRHDLDPVTGDVPVALWSKDEHSLWLNTAALARANGDLAVAGGVVELDEHGDPTGVLREESAWRFRASIAVSDDEYVEAMREGLATVHARGVTAIHDKDGRLGAVCLWQRLWQETAPKLRVWQSLPHERIEQLEELGLRSGFGDDWLRVGYLKAFADGALGSNTAWLLDGSGVAITVGEELTELVRRAARSGWPVAVHAIGDRANREVLDAFEATRGEWAPRGLRQRVDTPSASTRRTSPASRRSASLAPSSSVTRRPTGTWRNAAGRTGWTAPMHTDRCGTRGLRSRTARTRRSRSSTRCWESARPCSGRSTSATAGACRKL